MQRGVLQAAQLASVWRAGMRNRHRLFAALLGAMGAAVVPLVLRGFTVDDALISCRYAHHLASGAGYRFNESGPVTDGVTPLPWPWLLAPFSRGGPLASLLAAKVLGTVAWLAAAGALTWHVHGLARRRLDWPHLGIVVMSATPAVGAWAVSGMETGLATAVASTSLLMTGALRRRMAGAIIAGLACTLRPELLPWAVVLAVGHARCSLLDDGNGRIEALLFARRLVTFVSLASAPFIVVAIVRMIAFGRAAPLAVLAKPSDFAHGWAYALAGMLATGPFVAVVAPFAWLRLPSWPRWVLAAAWAHVITIMFVGGDWMPISRLFVPVLPSLGLVFAHLATTASTWSTVVRWMLCACGQTFVFWRVGADAAAVMNRREVLIEQLRPVLTAQDRVAAIDIGWVGASFDGTVIDLAGVTDPAVAGLPGGHTSKAIPGLFLADRGATVVVLQLPAGLDIAEAWRSGHFERAAECRLSLQPWVRAHFRPSHCLRSNDGLRYAVLTRVRDVGAP